MLQRPNNLKAGRCLNGPFPDRPDKRPIVRAVLGGILNGELPDCIIKSLPATHIACDHPARVKVVVASFKQPPAEYCSLPIVP